MHALCQARPPEPHGPPTRTLHPHGGARAGEEAPPDWPVCSRKVKCPNKPLLIRFLNKYGAIFFLFFNLGDTWGKKRAIHRTQRAQQGAYFIFHHGMGAASLKAPSVRGRFEGTSNYILTVPDSQASHTERMKPCGYELELEGLM